MSAPNVSSLSSIVLSIGNSDALHAAPVRLRVHRFSFGPMRTPETALALLEGEYPNFSQLVSGKRVLDFGCGGGYQSVALVGNYDCTVLAIDSNPKTLQRAKELAASSAIDHSRLTHLESIAPEHHGSFDIVISKDSFEHFPDPAAILELMQKLIADSGKILITFGPPWFAPYGSHMHFFCKIPWINLLLPEKVVLRWRSRHRDDGATRYEDVESGLNRMTIAKFERILAASGLRVEFRKYTPVKGVAPLIAIPGLRELFVNHVSVILSKNQPAAR